MGWENEPIIPQRCQNSLKILQEVPNIQVIQKNYSNLGFGHFEPLQNVNCQLLRQRIFLRLTIGI